MVLGASLVPVGAIAFALTQGVHDIRLALAGAPAPVGGICRQAIVYSLDPFAHAAYTGFAAAAVIAVTLGIAAGVATHLRTRRVLRGYRRVTPTPERLTQLAASASIRRIRLLESPRPLAFTLGYLAPSVAVSDTLLRVLNDAELRAVLLHEAEHLRRRDPLRLLVVTVIARAFAYAPLFGVLANAFRVAKEVEADEAAIRAMGSQRALVSALLSAGSYESEGASAGFADALSARIASLEGEDLPPAHPGWRAVGVTALTTLTIAAGLFVIATGAIDGHTLHVCA